MLEKAGNSNWKYLGISSNIIKISNLISNEVATTFKP